MNTRSLFLCLFLAAALAASVCRAQTRPDPPGAQPPFRAYTDIPGVTQEEIAAIEALKKQGDPLIYGSLFSTEAFLTDKGAVAGYTRLFCGRLSSLFGLTVTPRLYDWDELLAGLEDGTVDLSGDLIPTPARRERYAMTDAIAERSLSVFKKKGAPDIAEVAKKRPPRLAFLTGSSHLAAFRGVYPERFEHVYVDSYENAALMLRTDDLDAFIGESVADCFFIEFGVVESKPLFPLVYIPVSLTAVKKELRPFISVMNKYLAGGGQKELERLYHEGETDYKRYALFRSFTSEEKAYIEQAVRAGAQIPVVLESDNYPVSFFNSTTREFEGIAPDLLAAISGFTGLTFTTINQGGAKWEDLLASLTSGEAAIISELMYSEGRKNKFLWTETPFCTTSYSFISKTAFPDLEIYQVMSQKVGVIKGTVYEEMYNKWFPDNKPVLYDTGDLAFEALERDEITLVLAAEFLVLSQTNYREKSGYKVNIALNHAVEVKFGFNLKETALRSIISKAQGFARPEMIVKRWFGKVFDYSAELAQTRVYLLLICTALLLLLLAFISSYMFRNRTMRIKLEELVGERTHELRLRIEEREAAEREARIASSAKSSFLARMSHEIRTPLNAIIGMSEIAKKAAAGNDKALSAVNRVLASSRHLLGLINDILDMAKIESGKMVLASEPFSLGRAVGEVADIILPRCADKNIRFKADAAQVESRVVKGDKLRLNQVLINLLGNAVKFTNAGGETGITITLLEERPDNLSLAFSVYDNGIGMSREQVDKLFAPFEQTDASIASRFGGTGLGLSISKSLVNAMGGDISVSSAPGKGSTFRFALTLAKGELRASEAPEHSEPPDLAGARILLAEDIAVNRIIIDELLSPTGAIIDEAVNGAEAVARFADSPEGHYRLILMDIQMPELDGYEATAQIRALPRADADIPIVAMTANAYREDVERALAAGMNAHVSKPLDVGALYGVLAHLGKR